MDVTASVLMIVIEVLANDLFFQTFMEERFPKKRWLKGIILILLAVCWIIISAYAQFAGIKVLVGAGITSVFMMVIYRGSIGRILFCSVCCEGLIWGVDLVLLAVYQFFVDETATEVLQKDGKINLLWILFKMILFFLIVYINRRFARRDYQLLRDDEWVRFLFFPIFTVAAMIFMLLDEEMKRTTMFVLAIGLVIANIILFYLIRDFAERLEEKRKAGIQREQRSAQIENYENLERAYENQKKAVHEFKNHLGCIQGMLQESREKEALEYIRKINDSPAQYMNHFSTKNPIVDVIVNQKYKQARTEGIDMLVVMSGLKEIPMADEDLVVLLSNLLNNAIEACGRLKEKPKQIKFKFVQEQEKVVLSIRNPIEERLVLEDNQVMTTKSNKEEHGIGLGNIEKIIEKYGGEGMYEDEQGEFFYVIVFSIEKMKSVYEDMLVRSEET